MPHPSIRLMFAAACFAAASFTLSAQAKLKSAPAAAREPATAHRAKAAAKAVLREKKS